MIECLQSLISEIKAGLKQTTGNFSFINQSELINSDKLRQMNENEFGLIAACGILSFLVN